MKLKKNKIIVGFIVFSLVLVLLYGIVLYKEKNDIDNILKTKHYSYLPKEAQNYIKEVYEKTGELILTESNKVVNEPYLNPRYVSYLQLSNEQKQNVSLIPNLYSVDYVFAGSDSSNQEFPSSYNLENVDGKNYTSPMYNQGHLGTCWAFATIENAESHLMLQKDEPRNVNSTRFSVRQLHYAASTDGIKDYENPWGVVPLGLGGNFVYATTLMANGLSLVDDDYMPYEGTLNKKPLHEIHNYSNSLYEVNGTVNLPNFGRIEYEVTMGQCEDADDWDACYDEKSEELRQEYINIIKEGIMNYGGIYVGAYSPTGQCGALNTDGYYVLDPNATCYPMGNTTQVEEAHAMQIIGWDDDYKYSYCKGRNHASTVDGKCESGILTQGTGAWLVKNSWGESNAAAYIYLTYDATQNNYVDFAYITSLSEMDDKNWDNVYNNGKISSSSVAKLTQTFDKKLFNKEKIQKIKFHTILMNEEYSISVVANGNTYLITDSFKTEYPGLYTVDVIDKDIFIQTGDFEVIIKGTKKSINKNSISVFTKNMDNQQYILSEDKDIDSNKFTLYSDTRNIPSNTVIEYELYKGDEKLENVLEVRNNKVAANNVNAEILLTKKLEPGTYTLVQMTNDIEVQNKIDIDTILDGAGTEENPFKIYTEEDLKYIHKHLDSYYKLENDIELTSEWIPIGTEENPFTGAFDGNNHKIINLQINDSTLEYVGLFGYVKDSDEHQTFIKNIYLVNSNIVGNQYVGGLIGGININQTSEKTTLIDSIYIIGGNIEGEFASGLVADISSIQINFSLKINNIFSSATIKGRNHSSLIRFSSSQYNSVKGTIISNIQNMGIMYDNNSSNYKTSLVSARLPYFYSLTNYISTGYSKKLDILNQFYDTPIYDATDISSYLSNGYVLKRSNSTYEFPTGINGVSDIIELKNVDKYSEWGEDFNTYWEFNEEDGIKRMPVLKGVDLDYTEFIEDIDIEFGNDITLSEYISSELITSRLKVTTSDSDIIEINENYNSSEAYPYEIVISPLKQGTATIHVVSDYDGFEKDINIVVYKKELTITYHDGLDMITQTIINGVPVNLMKNKFVRGNEYIFVGWNTQEDGTGTSYSNEQEVTITDDLDLYAQWERKTVEISFNSNGGIGTMENYSLIYCESVYECEVGILPKNTFRRDGYRFKEWNTKVDGTGTSYNDEQGISINNDLILYAQWERELYLVTFDANDGMFTGDKTTIVVDEWDDTKLNTLERPIRLGYEFKGFFTEKEGGTSLENYIAESGIDKDGLVFYAQWEKVKHILSFDANGGIGNMDNQMFTYGDALKISKNVFTKEGYSFKGWNTKVDGTGDSYIDEQEISITDNLTLYAMWEESYSYVINKYTVDEDNKYIDLIDVGTTIDEFKNNIVLNDGYTVDVEYKSVNGENLIYTGGKTRIYKDGELYAEYTNIIRGDVNGNAVIDIIDYIRIMKHIMEEIVLEGEFFKAADVTQENGVDIIDYIRIMKMIMEEN